MEDFKKVSSLFLNCEKTEIMLDGGNNLRCGELSQHVGIKQGSLPVRYLDVPLSAKKMKRSNFQPLLDNFTCRFKSWTIKRPSYAGRLVEAGKPNE